VGAPPLNARRSAQPSRPRKTRHFSRAAESVVSHPLCQRAQTLDVLRDFSSILTHSLDAEAMLKQFLLFLREILSVNRAAIFLNRPCSPLAETVSPEDSRRCVPPPPSAFRPACSNILNCRWIPASAANFRLGRILRRDSDEGPRRRRDAKGI
jgi:hypothetical protein